MSVTEAPGRTHMYYTGAPEFEFGDGLSYTTFECFLDAPTLTADNRLPTLGTDAGARHTLQLRVRNTGDRGGVVRVLAMWRPVGDHLAPLRQKLVGFDGIHLEPGAEETLVFTLTSDHFAVANEHGRRIVSAGEYEVFFKGVQPGPGAASTRLTVTGPERLLDDTAM